MGVIRSMRPVKLLILSLPFFFGLLTLVGLLFPSTVHISRAIDLPGQQKLDLMKRFEDPAFRLCWMGDSGQILFKDGIQRTDSSITLAGTGSKQRLGWFFYGKEGSLTLQARMDIELGWMPWQRFQSLLLEPRYGPWLEDQLNEFRRCLSASQLVYSP